MFSIAFWVRQFNRYMDYQRVVVIMPLQTVSGRGIGVRVDLMIYRFRVSYRSFPPPHPAPAFTVLQNACSFRSTLLQLGGQKQQRRRGVSGTFSNDSPDLFSFRHLAHVQLAIVERQVEVSGHNILTNGCQA